MSRAATAPKMFVASVGGAATSEDDLTAAFEAHNAEVMSALERMEAENGRLRAENERMGKVVIPAAARRGANAGASHSAGASPRRSWEMVGNVADLQAAERRAEHEAALANFMRSGDAVDLITDRAANSVDSDPDGGFLAPMEVNATIMQMQRDISPMRRLARVVQTSADTYAHPVSRGGTEAGWVAEKDDRPETDGPQLSLLTIPSNEVYAQPAATQKLIDDARSNIAVWLESEISTTFAEKEGAAYISGNGVGKPMGLLSLPIVAERDNVRDWGKFEYVPTGASGAFPAAQADPLVDLMFRLKAGYRRNARWLMNSATGAVIAKFKDENDNLIWRQSLDAATPSNLLGYPVEFDENMPDIGADAHAIAFGDFQRGYIITDRMDVRLLRDPYTKKGFVLFYATKRVGGSPDDTQAIKFLKFSAS
ncbi:phage major capsid protein [Phreatobacter sp.]|uniref:phage major capsid protein n=1 Tax=Phreatobacter sp. TaxID=1966341 RepID=UPI003F720190